jgi:hypothetical protein
MVGVIELMRSRSARKIRQESRSILISDLFVLQQIDQYQLENGRVIERQEKVKG